jgi:hypothetical protein
MPTILPVDHLAQERPESGLLEVFVRRERIHKAVVLHHDKREAIGEAPGLISSVLTQQRGILATRSLALLRSQGRPSPLHKARRKRSALPAHRRLRRGYPTERGGPPPFLGLSPGLCGPGRTVA